MKNAGILLQLFVFAMLCSCKTITEPEKSRLANGYYVIKKPQGKPEPRYVLYRNDTIRVYPVNLADKKTIDTTRTSMVVFPRHTEKPEIGFYAFRRKSWDLNFQTAIFKFRTERANIPNQLNTEFNFNLYFGRRTDVYRISYQANPLDLSKRKFDHFAYSVGIFTGFGESPISGTVTKARIAYVYEGLVWLNGVGAIIGFNNFTIGAGVGMDQLLDRNHDVWIYQRKPWFGLMLGLKLN